ncbi:hypothetical protein WJX72_005092 [[Myrmecia] bisecta]|uniref:Uncharacterized protein n=1 Tax=[Myrmecia] bisecta TaxID=41462 RepID=A0AAW1QF17_9CHLO
MHASLTTNTDRRAGTTAQEDSADSGPSWRERQPPGQTPIQMAEGHHPRDDNMEDFGQESYLGLGGQGGPAFGRGEQLQLQAPYQHPGGHQAHPFLMGQYGMGPMGGMGGMMPYGMPYGPVFGMGGMGAMGGIMPYPDAMAGWPQQGHMHAMGRGRPLTQPMSGWPGARYMPLGGDASLPSMENEFDMYEERLRPLAGAGHKRTRGDQLWFD